MTFLTLLLFIQLKTDQRDAAKLLYERILAGIALENTGGYPAAIDHFRKCVLDTNDPKCGYYFSYYLFMNEQLDEAEEVANATLKIAGSSYVRGPTHLILMLIRIKKGELDAALSHIDAAIEIGLNDEDKLTALVERAAILNQKGKTTESIVALKKLNAQNGYSYEIFSLAYSRLGEYNLALEYINKSMRQYSIEKNSDGYYSALIHRSFLHVITGEPKLSHADADEVHDYSSRYNKTSLAMYNYINYILLKRWNRQDPNKEVLVVQSYADRVSDKKLKFNLNWALNWDLVPFSSDK